MTECDLTDLEERLVRIATEVCGYRTITAETPMHEIRAMAEQAGMMFGRMYAAAIHSGPITAELAMEIRASEQRGKERFVRSASQLFGVGGELRELLTK